MKELHRAYEIKYSEAWRYLSIITFVSKEFITASKSKMPERNSGNRLRSGGGLMNKVILLLGLGILSITATLISAAAFN